MYQPCVGLEYASAPAPKRDDAKLYRQAVMVVLLCVMAAIIILSGIPARGISATGREAGAATATGWSQVLVKLQAVVYPAEKS